MVIIEGAVHELKPDPWCAAGGLVLITAATVRPPAATHIDMHQLARPVPLIQLDRSRLGVPPQEWLSVPCGR